MGTRTDLLVCCLCVCASPSQPRSTCPMVARASAKRSGRRPFRSTVARQPWNPSREWTSLGRSRYISLETPPMYRSPDEEQQSEWQLHEPIIMQDCISVGNAGNHCHYWLVRPFWFVWKRLQMWAHTAAHVLFFKSGTSEYLTFFMSDNITNNILIMFIVGH